MLACANMLPRLRAEELLAAVDVEAAGRFDMRPSSRRALLRRWLLEARPPTRRRRRRGPASEAELAAVGIGITFVERPPGGPEPGQGGPEAAGTG